MAWQQSAHGDWQQSAKSGRSTHFFPTQSGRLLPLTEN
ncbi:hypothetical protein PMO01_11160 [Pseudomonas moraviensis R28-S]|uniref:Uncharacterized protein n=1 Tax=Pseudomonas moraviensis R28-S TaxID=1395516 RepID=V8REY4_9PSED|nr:hypothetical protein PMO01_11160 [Pseudomonas moraviensis R28-S]